MPRIVLTGSESTGKTMLATQLAGHYQCKVIPEYARSYIERLRKPYSIDDVLHIGQKQLNQYREVVRADESVIFDTWLIITKVWLKVVYNSEEKWIDEALKNSKIDLYILCSNDLPWTPDPVRENGGIMRERLFDMYQRELISLNLPYRVINGQGEERFKNTLFTIEEYFNN